MSAAGRKMSLAQATMLVAGNMIGTGIFLLPVNLAQVGSISIYGWLIATAGAAGLGLVFARLGQVNPQQGGPVRLRARFSRAVRRIPDQLHLLVRQLGGQHRDRGRGGGLPRRTGAAHRRAAGQHHRHRADHLAADLRQHQGSARGGPARSLDHGAGADSHRGDRPARLVLVQAGNIPGELECQWRFRLACHLARRLDGAVGLHGHRERGRVGRRHRKSRAATCRSPPSSAWCSRRWSTC